MTLVLVMHHCDHQSSSYWFLVATALLTHPRTTMPYTKRSASSPVTVVHLETHPYTVTAHARCHSRDIDPPLSPARSSHGSRSAAVASCDAPSEPTAPKPLKPSHELIFVARCGGTCSGGFCGLPTVSRPVIELASWPASFSGFGRSALALGAPQWPIVWGDGRCSARSRAFSIGKTPREGRASGSAGSMGSRLAKALSSRWAC